MPTPVAAAAAAPDAMKKGGRAQARSGAGAEGSGRCTAAGWPSAERSARHFLLLRTCRNALLALANMAPQCGHAPGTDPLTEKHINALASKTSRLSSSLNSWNSLLCLVIPASTYIYYVAVSL